MALLGPQAAGFLARYAANWTRTLELAELAGEYIRELLSQANLDLHAVTARAKTPESARAKILAKRYGNPGRQLTDQIGVRVISYFESDIDRIASDVRQLLDIEEVHSSDRRRALGLREFGYRSVHLVARVKPTHLGMRFERLSAVRLEIQIRSILEHAWAEIEHEVVYKAGIQLPDETRRQFSAIAGTLEILEKEFASLRRQRDELIEQYRVDVQNGHGLNDSLDAARLLGHLEARRPDGLGWRQAASTGKPFPPRIEASCVRALEHVGATTSSELDKLLTSSEFASAAASYAAEQGLVPSQLSHLAVVVIAVGVRDYEVAVAFLSDLASNSSIRSALGFTDEAP